MQGAQARGQQILLALAWSRVRLGEKGQRGSENVGIILLQSGARRESCRLKSRMTPSSKGPWWRRESATSLLSNELLDVLERRHELPG